jgi:signal transduction histidine kinase
MQTTGTLVFYTAAVTIIAAFFLFNAALKNRVGLYYATLFAIMLALVWVLDGGLALLGETTQGQTRLGQETAQSIGLSIGLVGASFGFFTAERAIDPRRAMTGIRRALLGFALFSLALVFGAWFQPSAPMPYLVDLMLVLMFAAHLVSTLTWRTQAEKPFRLPAIIAFLLLLAIGGVFVAVLLQGDVIFTGVLFRWVFALVAIPSMAAIGLAVADVRRSRDTALAAAARAARKDAQMSSALLETERNYTRARDIAAQRMRQISTVSHDIRQPIGAMRAELDSLKGEIDADNAERLDRILDHFDALSDEYTRTDAPIDSAADGEGYSVSGGVRECSGKSAFFDVETHVRGGGEIERRRTSLCGQRLRLSRSRGYFDADLRKSGVERHSSFPRGAHSYGRTSQPWRLAAGDIG